MAEDNKQLKRITSVAKDFNIAPTTIIEFLKKKGFEVSNLNAKLEEDQYRLIANEFQSDRTMKENAKKIDIGLPKAQEQESLEKPTKKPAKVEQEQESKEIIIRDTTLSKTPANSPSTNTTSAKAVKEEKATSIEEQPATATENIPIKKETQENKNIDNEIIQKDSAAKSSLTDNNPIDTTSSPIITNDKANGPKIIGKINLDQFKKNNNKKDEHKFDKKPSKSEHVENKNFSQHKNKKDNLQSNDSNRRDNLQSNDSNRRDNLQSNDSNKRDNIQNDDSNKKQQNKVGKYDDKKDSAVPTNNKQATNSDTKSQDKVEKKTEHITISAPTLKGVTILRTIDLPVEKAFNKTKNNNSAGGDEQGKNKKKKRERLKDQHQKLDKFGKVDDVNKTTNPTDKDKTKNDKFGGKKFGSNKKFKKDFKKVQFSEEDVQKQVRETLSELVHKPSKSKSVQRRKDKKEFREEERRRQSAEAEADKMKLKVTEFVTVNELAKLMNVPVTQVIQTCLNLGVMVSINQRLDAETMTVVTDEFGFDVEFVDADLHETSASDIEENEEDKIARNPIVTVMGHVDHGKTSLLDNIRKTNVIAGEAGGITQHIGAYEVHLPNGRSITFLDTPGHEAFTAMRARGAKMTDIAIIVVAADDKVMPQTIEAINHAQAANVPIVIAINKIDKPNANPEKIKEELAGIRILVEDWGGKFQCQEISAKQGTNLDLLLEKVLLESDILDLKGNPKKRAEGTVIESSLEKGRGYVAKVLVQDGTLHQGDIVVAGSHYGKVKALFNDKNQKISDAGPSTPILLLGLDGAPQAGDTFVVFKKDHEAKAVVNKRIQLQREMGIRTQKHITLDEIGRRIAIGDFKELNIIVKGDVDGSIEALSDSLLKLSTEEVQVNVIHKSVGQITETDVMLASASNAIIVGFQVRPSANARKLAEQEQIDIRTYSVIYKAIDEIKAAIEGMLSPEIEEKITCNVEIREIYKISKVGTIAGCLVQSGSITRNTKIRLIRDGIVIYSGSLGSLKRFKDDAKEVKAGYECGLNIENFNDIKVGDIIEGFEEIKISRSL